MGNLHIFAFVRTSVGPPVRTHHDVCLDQHKIIESSYKRDFESSRFIPLCDRIPPL